MTVDNVRELQDCILALTDQAAKLRERADYAAMRYLRLEEAALDVFGHSLMKQMEGTTQPTEGSLWWRLARLREVLEAP